LRVVSYAPQDMPEKTKKEENESPPQESLKSVRTFRSDAVEAARSRGHSLAQIVLSEQAKRERAETVQKKRLGINVLLLGLGATLIITGIVLAFFAFSRESIKKEEQPYVPTSQELILTNYQEKIGLTARFTGEEIRAAIAKEIETSTMQINNIKSIYFTKTVSGVKDGVEVSEEGLVGLTELLGVAGSNIPQALLRSFDESFMFGLYSFVENRPFIILKTNAYENAFAGMLAWEKTMLKDLAYLFVFNSAEQEMSGQKFRDIIIKNLDARIIEDANKNPVLLYSFIARDTLVIATNKTTFDEIIKRLLVPRAIKQ